MKNHENESYRDHTMTGLLRASWSPWKVLDFLAELHGHVSTASFALLPAGQIRWRPFPALSTALLYSEGLRDPSLGERFVYPIQVMLPENLEQCASFSRPLAAGSENDLKAERSRKMEGSLQLSVSHFLQADIRGYWNAVRHEIVPWITGDTLSYRNTGSSDYLGAGIGLVMDYSGFSVHLAADVLRARDGAGAQLLERPTLTGSASASWKGVFFQGDLLVHMTCGCLYSSDYWAVSGTLGDPYLEWFGSSVLLHLQASLTVMHHADLYIALDNLLDSYVRFFADYAYPKRTIRTGVRWDLFD